MELIICDVFKTTPKLIKSKCRKWIQCAYPRFVMCHLLKEHTVMTTEQIALRYNIDRTTMLHGQKVMKDELNYFFSYRKSTELIDKYWKCITMLTHRNIIHA